MKPTNKKKWHTQTRANDNGAVGRSIPYGDFYAKYCTIGTGRAYPRQVPSQLKKRPTTLLCAVHVDAVDHNEIQLKIGFLI